MRAAKATAAVGQEWTFANAARRRTFARIVGSPSADAGQRGRRGRVLLIGGCAGVSSHHRVAFGDDSDDRAPQLLLARQLAAGAAGRFPAPGLVPLPSGPSSASAADSTRAVSSPGPSRAPGIDAAISATTDASRSATAASRSLSQASCRASCAVAARWSARSDHGPSRRRSRGHSDSVSSPRTGWKIPALKRGNDVRRTSAALAPCSPLVPSQSCQRPGFHPLTEPGLRVIRHHPGSARHADLGQCPSDDLSGTAGRCRRVRHRHDRRLRVERRRCVGTGVGRAREFAF